MTRYMETGDPWIGDDPPNQYGFGVYKTTPIRQRGFGVYKTRRRSQRGHGPFSMLASIGRQVLPVAKQVGKKIARRAVKEGIKALPALALHQNKGAVVKKLANNIGKQAIGEALGALKKSTGVSVSVSGGKKKKKRIKRVGALSRKRGVKRF